MRKPKPKGPPVLFKKRNSDQHMTPRVFEDFAGAKLWTCFGCKEPMGNNRMVLIPSERHGFSHDLYHQGCAGQSN
jgi:hypothetical protein